MNSNYAIRYNRQANLLWGQFYDLSANDISISGNTYLNNTTSNGVFEILDGIYTNGLTISNNALSFIANLTSDAQTQLNSISSSVSSLTSSLSSLSTTISNISTNITGLTYDSADGSTFADVVNFSSITNFSNPMNISSNISLGGNLNQTSGTNNLLTTTINNLTITNSLTLPSTITMPATTFTNNNETFTGTAIITQTGTGTNLFKKTEFSQSVQFDTSFNQIAGNATLLSLTNTGTFTENGTSNLNGAVNVSGLITANGSLALYGYLNMPSASTLYVNGLSVSSLSLSYLYGLSQNVNTALTALQTATTGLTYSSSTGTTIANALNLSNQLNLTGNLYVSSTSITPLLLSYLSGLSGNIQSQINSLPTTGTVSSISGIVSSLQNATTNLSYSNSVSTFNDTLQVSNGYLDLSLSSGLKTISSIIITPTQLSYLSGLSQNVNTALANVETATQNITAGGAYTSISGETFLGNGSTVLTSPTLTIGDGAFDNTSNYGTVNITRKAYDTTRSHLAMINAGNFIWELGYAFDNSNNDFGIYPANYTTSNGSPLMRFSNAGTVLINGSLNFTGLINSISTTTFGYLSGLTSNIQSQINSLDTTLQGFSYNSSYGTICNNNFNVYGNVISTGSLSCSSISTGAITSVGACLLEDGLTVGSNTTIAGNAYLQNNINFGTNAGLYQASLSPSYTYGITTNIIGSTTSTQIATITIPSNNNLKTYFNLSISFYESVQGISSYSGAIGSTNEILTSITYAIYKNGTLFKTITQTPNYVFTWSLPSSVLASAGTYTNTVYCTTMSPILIDDAFYTSATTYTINATMNQTITVLAPISSTTAMGFANQTYFMYNNSLTPSNFTFGYGSASNMTTSGTLYLNTGDFVNSNITNLTATTASIPSIVGNTLSLTSPLNLINCSSGYMTAYNNGIAFNCNTANGGAATTISLPQNSLFLVHIDNGSRTDPNGLQYQCYFYCLTNGANTSTSAIFNASYNISNIAGMNFPIVSGGFSISCSVSSGSTSFYCYYVQVY